MPSSDKLTHEEIAAEGRRTLARDKSRDEHNRKAYDSNYQFLNLNQWDPYELQRRQNKRLVLTADQLNGPVDQVVNGVRQNRPGPKVSPEGSGTDIYDANVMEGLMRRVDYENSAWDAWELATECAVGGNFGCFAMGLDYENDHSFARRITVEAIPNPNETIWFDSDAMRRDRADGMHAHRLYFLSPEKYLQMFGTETKLAKQMGSDRKTSRIRQFIDSVQNRQSYSGWVAGEIIQVSKYYRVEIEKDTLREYTNGVAYLDSEKQYIPATAKVNKEVPSREVEIRNVRWYFIDCYEVLKEGTWGGPFIPLFPVYGRERWVGNVRWVTSLIQGAKDMQQALNYCLTSACEVLAAVSKSPWLGLAGQFRTKPIQWKNANKEINSYLEYDEVLLPNGQYHVAAPQRDTAEPPINAFMSYANACIGFIQRATSIFDTSLGRSRSDQSGRAIAELQEQSAEGNFHWASALTTCLTHYYRCMGDLIQREYDKDTVMKIIRPDNKIEEARINAEFKFDPESKSRVSYSLSTGSFTYAVSVGPSSTTQRQAVEKKITALLKVLPPQMVGSIADLLLRVMDLGPLGEEMSNRVTPPQYRDKQDPAAMTQQLAQLSEQNQGLQQALMQLQKAIDEKQPQLEVEKYLGELDAQVRLMTAQMKDGQVNAKREADVLLAVLKTRSDNEQKALDRENNLHVVIANQSDDKSDDGD